MIKVVALGSVASVKSGYAFKSKDWTDGGVPVIKIANIKDGFIELDGCSYVREPVAAAAKAFELNPGDILISMTGYIGEIARVRNEGRMLLNQRVGKFTILNPSELDSNFLFYCLRDPAVKAKLAGRAYGAAQPNISPALIEQQEIPLPNTAIQRRIADILSAYDDLIYNCQRRIAVLEQMARALYREWFVKFRYPGHESVPLVSSSLGEIPKGWEISELEGVADVNRAQVNVRSAPASIRYIDISSVSPGRIDEMVDYAFADAPGRARRIVVNGDVIWSCVRPNRRSYALVMNPKENTLASTGFAVLSANAVPFSFLYCAVTTEQFVQYLVSNSTGAAYPAVTAATFEKANLVVPTDSLLRRFDAVALPTLALADSLHAQVNNLRRTRDLLLPRLISGQLEVDAA